MSLENVVPPHPGAILAEEYLRPLGITQVGLASHLGIPVQRINELVRGKRGVTPETAWLLAHALGTAPEYWLDRQMAYDLARSRPANPPQILASLEPAHATVAADIELTPWDLLGTQTPPTMEWDPSLEPETW